ncbi:MAG TPA: tRNA (N6-isopentenyl adenosine(37)-C2)-methylthiotransferase MiaB [Acidimicrobiales bacterium]|nr:tRNA (N6-isopentenyl adenosine(37)-C2)-methylthiotransferase MiaB [Acidimicrobiales bacterium]
MQKFHVRTFGCQMNEHDSERIAALFGAEGMERTDDPEDADYIVLNTCCIRENADNKLYGHLGHLKSLRDRKPDLQIAVGGCLAQKDRDLLAKRAPHVDAVFGTHNIGRAVTLLREARSEGRQRVEILETPEADDFPTAMAVRADLPYAAWVTIQIGCDNSCAFCIVPAVRGPEVSRPFEEIVSEVANLAALGTTEVTLLGQNVNSYGRDGAANPRPRFAELLRAVGAIDGIERVRYTSPHPKDLRPDTIAAMAETPAVCEHLHLPLQSGSDDVLKAMRRGYTAERYLAKLRAARAAIPGLAVTTDIIVGFPGETDADFERTLEVAAEASYDSAYTFIFSPRPGTRAAEMLERAVPEEVIAERFARLKVVIDRSALAKHEARVGLSEEVVVEGRSKKDPAALAGRTRQNKLVNFRPEISGEPVDLSPGRYATVRVEKAGAHHLNGKLQSVADLRAVPGRRIPLRVAAG